MKRLEAETIGLEQEGMQEMFRSQIKKRTEAKKHSQLDFVANEEDASESDSARSEMSAKSFIPTDENYKMTSFFKGLPSKKRQLIKAILSLDQKMK